MDAFSPDRGPIILQIELSGPTLATVARVILDTGATTTVIKPGILLAIGYDSDSEAEMVLGRNR